MCEPCSMQNLLLPRIDLVRFYKLFANSGLWRWRKVSKCSRIPASLRGEWSLRARRKSLGMKASPKGKLPSFVFNFCWIFEVGNKELAMDVG
jgi:hypothetical protein